MSYDSCVRIEKLTNGYSVCLKDPEIVKANRKPSTGKDYVPYKDPERTYVFKTVEEVLAFLKKNLDKALPDDEYDSAFDVATKELKDD